MRDGRAKRRRQLRRRRRRQVRRLMFRILGQYDPVGFDSAALMQVGIQNAVSSVNAAFQDFFRRNPGLTEAMPVNDDDAWRKLFGAALANEPGFGDARDQDGWPVFAYEADVRRLAGGVYRWQITEHLTMDQYDENPSGETPDHSSALITLLDNLASRHPSRMISELTIYFDAPEGIEDRDALNGRFRATITRAGDGRYVWHLWKGEEGSFDASLPEASLLDAVAAARRFVAERWGWAVLDSYDIELGFVGGGPVSGISALLSGR